MIVSAHNSYSNVSEEYQGFVQSIKNYVKYEMDNSTQKIVEVFNKNNGDLKVQIENQAKVT